MLRVISAQNQSDSERVPAQSLSFATAPNVSLSLTPAPNISLSLNVPTISKNLTLSTTSAPKSLALNTTGPKSLALNTTTAPKSLVLNTTTAPKSLALNTTIGPNSLALNTTTAPKSLALNTIGPNSLALNTQPINGSHKMLVIGGQSTGVVYPSADNYKEYDQRTHVYMKTDTYVGADEKMVRDEWLFDIQTGKMVNSTIDFIPACERIYLEILTNASDNMGRSRRAGVDPGRIEILMNNSTISVTNYGLPIPIEIHPIKQVYVPQMIFGGLLTSSNYEVDRHEAGTNGIGAKATNIFSTEFVVIVHDHTRHLKYTQIWTNNMIQRSEPVIENYPGDLSSVQIIYKMDFARFKYPVPNGDQGGYPIEAFALFARHAIDISFTSKAVVMFNGREINYINIRDYARLYFGEAVDNAIVHYQWPPNTEVINKKKGYQIAKNPSITPEIELIAIDTPDNGYHVSFVNCMMTRDGGVHVNAAVKAVGDSAVQMINDSVVKKMVKHNKGKELDAKEKRAHTININDVKPHISILLAVKVINPKFTSQTKTVLHSPVPKIEVGEEELRAMGRWQLTDRLYAALDAKQFATLTKTDGKLKRYVRLLKGIDANNAGKADRHQCVLYITEGRSGASYANKLVGMVSGGRDNIGVLPMRGKSLNVMNADRFQIEANAEIKELKKMLGLSECPDPNMKDTYYLEQTNFNRLRYGAIMIMADSDVDGKHIIGLILNLFYCRYPSLLARGFVMFYRTPILRVSFNKQVYKFYTQNEYDEWKAKTPNYQSWYHKYYKGLGSSDDPNIKDDFRTPRVVTCFYDVDAPRAMKLAFDKNYTDQRKDWIGRWRHVIGVDDIQIQPISWFINHEFILFSIADTQRSIPKLTDGLKESHRKIIHGAHLKWKIGSKSKTYTQCKVAQFGAFIAEKSCYHHGELILDDVVLGMAQDFTCANNIPWFTRDGQFGSRYQGGKDAAETRYSYTRPERLVSFIIRKEDRPILKHVIDEGQTVEPETYYPIIPMILVNGGQGIGTGYSTFVPCHNPLEIIKWLRMKLQGISDDNLPVVHPWYRGFQGTIRVIDRRSRKKRGNKVNVTIINNLNTDGVVTPEITVVEAEDEPNTKGEDSDDEYEGKEVSGSRPLLSMITMGKFHMDLNGTIIITELPLFKWAHYYHKWLEELVEEKVITGFRDCSVDNNVYFEIYGFKDSPTHRTLRLQTTKGMSNMVLLDDNSKPVRYDTSFDILEAFYSRRLPMYQVRKDFVINRFIEEIQILNDKIRFIRAVINKEIRVMNRRKAEIMENMDRLGISRDLLTKTNISNFTEDEIEASITLIASKEAERANIESLSPEQTWINELNELENTYRSEYGLKKEQITLNIVKVVDPKTFQNTTPEEVRQPAQAIMPNVGAPIKRSIALDIKGTRPTKSIYLNV